MGVWGLGFGVWCVVYGVRCIVYAIYILHSSVPLGVWYIMGYKDRYGDGDRKQQ